MVRNWIFVGRGRTIMSIADFAASEVLPSKPNDSGVFMDCVNVEIPIGAECVALLCIARDSAGTYYTGFLFEDLTGGRCFAPSPKWNRSHTQEEAFLEGTRILHRNLSDKKVDKYLRAAKREYFNHKHIQLSLF